MKKFKNISKMFLCFVMMICTVFSFTACNFNNDNQSYYTKEEVDELLKEKQSETISYSKEEAMAIYSSAISDFISAEKIKATYNWKFLEFNSSNNPQSIFQEIKQENGYTYQYLSIVDYIEYAFGYYDDKFVFIDCKEKTYSSLTANAAEEVEEINEYNLLLNMPRVLPNIIAGKVVNNETYITALVEVNEDPYMASFYITIKIVDGKFVSVNVIGTDRRYEKPLRNTSAEININISYGDSVEITKIPTSLVGYTDVTEDSGLSQD